ncbi:PD-(D/E)XK nuclease family protein [Aquihabitans daechungensis]|uniref:PD-(D/E)XK nuclease family protein n=1 Tax=Aquihabitans daechungensis TaxID=1052257 RepID=UPI003BA2ACCA
MPSATPSELNPAQQRTLDALGATGAERPVFDPELAPRLRADLEAGLVDVLGDLGPDEDLNLSKHLLGRVHGCEVRLLAEDAADEPFTVTVPIARGSIAHKAVELGIHWSGEPLPLDLVDEAMASLAGSDHWLTEFLQTCSEAERAEFRSTASDRVAKFFECFPPLDARWRPVTESSQIVDLAGGRVRLRGKVDLTLGTARGMQAGKVIVDLKTGAPNPVHRDDLRFYALLDTLRLGVPPRLVASFYLDLAEARTEAVSEGVLDATVARTIDAAQRLAALRAGTVEPVYRPSYGCRWCVALPDCKVGRSWLTEETDEGLADEAD